MTTKMPLDFNDALPWPFTEGAMDAALQVNFEGFMELWDVGLSQLYERDEQYDPKDFKQTFLQFCAEEFDRYYANTRRMDL